MNNMEILFQRTSLAAHLKYSIVIPTWNNLAYLKLCLDSLARHSRHEHQLIIHVNEGSDGTIEWLDNHFKGDVTYSKENVGVCHALNFASTLVQTNYLVYLNDDMYCCPDWDVPLWNQVQKAKNRYFFYSGTLMQDGPFKDKSVISNCTFGGRIENFDEERFLKEWNLRQHDDWNGATWPPNIVHIDTWNEVGGYSVEFSPGMYSDPDFSMKLWKIGVRDFRGLGQSRVYHFESVSTGRIKKNPGSRQFLSKWGITNSTFGKHYLKRGTTYTGPLEDPEPSISFVWDAIRSKIKRLFSNI